MKKERKISKIDQGITLVALVITIIILLILAGVTLSTALGENGLFQRAKLSVEKYKEAEDDENEKIKGIEDIFNEIEGGNPKEPETPEKGKTTIEVSDIGKKVDYDIDLDGDNSTYDWKIFYQGTSADELTNGRIYIIASDYVPLSNSLLTTATANMELSSEADYQNFCKSWTNKIPENSEDMQNKDLFMTSMYNLNEKDTINTKCISTLLNTSNWEGFAKGNCGELAIGGPTIEMWCAAWNKLMPESGEANEDGFMKLEPTAVDTDSGYNLSSSKIKNQNGLYMNGETSNSEDISNLSSEEKYNVFFPHTTSSVTANKISGSCSGYWLASPSDYYADNLMRVWYSGQVGGSNYDGGTLGVRPVVLLKSGVQLNWDESEQIYKIS